LIEIRRFALRNSVAESGNTVLIAFVGDALSGPYQAVRETKSAILSAKHQAI